MEFIIFVVLCWMVVTIINKGGDKDMASALENLTAATVRLTASVDQAVTVLNTPHVSDAQAQTAADAVNAQSDRLDAAANPPTA